MAISVQHSRKAKDCDDSIVDFLCDTEADVAAIPTQRRSAGGGRGYRLDCNRNRA